MLLLHAGYVYMPAHSSVTTHYIEISRLYLNNFVLTCCWGWNRSLHGLVYLPSDRSAYPGHENRPRGVTVLAGDADPPAVWVPADAMVAGGVGSDIVTLYHYCAS